MARAHARGTAIPRPVQSPSVNDDSALRSSRRPSRRAVLAGTAGLVGLAGCVGGGGGGSDAGADADDGDSTPTPAATGAATTTGGGRTLADHPAGRDIDAQPHLGPPPGEATATVVAFEDPSCPRCAVFEQQTVPRIRSELVEPGDATFVFRGYPVVYEWGGPATRALEATFERDLATHWELASHYFDTQDAFSTANVLDRTRSFLSESAVDADAVVGAVEDGAADAAVETDLAAGEAAGATATPSVYLFRDGEYRTKAAGSVSFSVVKNALGL